MSRVYDIILWGATGFTGKLICRHFVNHNDEKLKIAIGGRNKQKLENQKESEQYPSDWGIVVGNSSDLTSMKEVTKLGKVVLCSAGPFLSYSKLVVEACVFTGTHYCDITGETDFYKISLDKFEKKTIEDGTSIVHCCGYDSLPCDVGCYLVGSQLIKEENTKGEIQAVLTHVKGGFSGGTVSTLFQTLDNPSAPPSLFQLNPPGQASGSDTDQMGLRYDNDVKAWTGFSLMSTVNNRVARRTAAVEGFSAFTISESMKFGSPFKAIGVTFAIFLFVFLAYFKMIRSLLMKFLPSPGAGPTPKEQKTGFAKYSVIGQGDKSKVMVKVLVPSDPGYSATAVMVSECAKLLAQGKQRRPGVMGPAIAFQEGIVESLIHYGFKFDTVKKL